MKENTETTLVRAALNGDADSFGRLCERYYSAMVAIAYSRLNDRDLAEDAAQEAFFVAFRNISKLKKQEHFSRWVAGICRNIASDMAKARTRDKLVSIQDCEPLSKNEDKKACDVEIVRSIVAELPVKMKEVIFLRYYNQMSYQEITDVLGISQEAVNGRLRRAKKIVARELRRRA
ncbi:MAG: sigma-70 family RNA polymerase sigma factor [Woeseiaceae bacterium]|nr:sigma-70 family RNA polymerase sigma factor [Woeseiaceae bacterium]